MHADATLTEAAPNGCLPSSPGKTGTEARFQRALLDLLPQQVFFKDLDSVFISVNAAFARDFGKSTKDFEGKTDRDFFPAHLAQKYARDDRRIMQGRIPEMITEENVIGGQTRHVEVTKAPVTDEAGEVVGLIGIFRDITDLKAAEQEVRRSQTFLNSVIQHLPAMVFMKQASDLRLVLWNPASEELTGRKASEVLGKTDFDLFSPEDAEAYVAADRRTLSSGILDEVAEEVMQTPHNGVRVVTTKKIPILNEKGQPEYLLGISEDVTDRKAAEAQLRLFAARLEENNRELQDFAYVASHDLQEPLRKVRAFGDRLRTKCGAALSPEGLDYLSRMLNAAQRMQGLIEDLLAFSRVTTRAQPFVPVDLSQVTREVISDLEIRIEQVQGRVEVGDLPTIDADATQMRQLLQNLIGNALKFHRKDVPPVVKVTAEVDPAEPVGKGSALRLRPRFCRLQVQDNGIGFDEKYLEKIFTVFQRLHGRGEYEGSGVGLAICRKIVVRHQGQITARSKPGEGATFVVTLPVQQ